MDHIDCGGRVRSNRNSALPPRRVPGGPKMDGGASGFSDRASRTGSTGPSQPPTGRCFQGAALSGDRRRSMGAAKSRRWLLGCSDPSKEQNRVTELQWLPHRSQKHKFRYRLPSAIGPHERNAALHTRSFQDFTENAAALTASLIGKGGIDRFSFFKGKAGCCACGRVGEDLGKSRFRHSPAVVVENPWPRRPRRCRHARQRHGSLSPRSATMQSYGGALRCGNPGCRVRRVPLFGRNESMLRTSVLDQASEVPCGRSNRIVLIFCAGVAAAPVRS